MTDFNIGDKVKIKKSDGLFEQYFNRTGRVISIEKDYVKVELDGKWEAVLGSVHSNRYFEYISPQLELEL